MSITLEKLVRDLDTNLLREHGQDIELFETLESIQRDSGILHGDRPICPFLRPYFLAESKYNAIRSAAATLSGAFASLTKAALDHPEIMSELGVSEKEELWARLDTGYLDVSINSRLDTFLTAEGFAFLEYNGENPAGIGDQAALERLFTNVPIVDQFLRDNQHHYPQPQIRLLDVLDSSYRDFGGRKAKPNIAIVDWAGVSTRPEFVILEEYFETRGYATKICVPGDLEYKNSSLRAGDFEIDIFFKRVLIHEFLEQFDETHPLYQACSDGNVCMVNSFRSKIPHKKASFAILTDPRYRGLFNAEQHDIIRQHVPWTRNFRYGETNYNIDSVDLVEYVRNARERFVLKPNDEYGGKGIYFGWDSSEAEWDAAIEIALNSHYIVQERVSVEKTNIPVYMNGEARIKSLTVDFDPFLFRGNVEGGMVRLASGSLVNITSGGGETALAILQGF